MFCKLSGFLKYFVLSPKFCAKNTQLQSKKNADMYFDRNMNLLNLHI